MFLMTYQVYWYLKTVHYAQKTEPCDSVNYAPLIRSRHMAL